MAILKIVTLSDPILRAKCNPIKNIDKKIIKIAHDMLETMYDAPGVGLAANQVGLNFQLVVIDATRDPEKYGKNPIILFNPRLLEVSGKKTSDEGCLSIPSQFEQVTRPAYVKASYIDEKGQEHIIETEGLLAQALQHEIDHLNGKLYIDLLTSIKRNFIKKKYKKQQSHETK